MTREDLPLAETLPLRERLPDYLAIFAAGLAGAGLVGLGVGGMSETSFAAGFGYALIGLAVILWLAGGVSGGGYANLGAGALGTMFGSSLRNPEGTAEDDDVEELRRQVFGKRMNPHERLRRGLRPEANPRAFWQVIAGFLYFVIGTWIVIRFPS